MEFPRVKTLQQVGFTLHFTLYSSEVVALLGENGEWLPASKCEAYES
ncbi:hypothetical protein [Sodalis-like endosymbiont of Proechinophthirus fluctus]|nr:hypothetical protein [Sodalis-like endosymbiont of Proechinophthirus fluctus]